MYFHTDDPAMIEFIASVANLARAHGQSLRVNVDSQGRLTIKRGEGVWSAPFSGTPDQYRDNSNR